MFEGRAPSEAQLATEVERLRRSDPDLSLSAATQMAAESWGSREETTTTKHDRAPFSPMRLIDEDGQYEETTTDLRYGFGAAMGEDQPRTPDPEDAPSQPMGSAMAAEAPPQATIPQQAVEALRADPSLREQFDAKYGPGAAAQILGN
jgi:hypothetical protein